MTSNAEEQANTQAAATVQPPIATKRAHVAPQAPCYAHQGQGAQEGHVRRQMAQKPKGRQGREVQPRRTRGQQGSQSPGLLRRPDGASLKELMKATGWLAHSVSGFLSGTIAKRMKLSLVSEKKRGRRSPLLAEGLIMPASGSNEQKHHYRDDGFAPYSEVVVWRRRFYLALAAAFGLLGLMLICAGRA